MDDDDDFQPSQWRNGQWVPCGQRPQRPQRQPSSQNSSQCRQSQPPQRPTQSTQRNPTPDFSAQLLSLLQSAAKSTPKEKKPKVDDRERLQCLLCASTLATQTTLFRHYKNQHNINNPARFLGYKESNVFNLDTTVEESECSVCGLVVPNSHALNIHVKAAHNTGNTASNTGSTSSNETVNTAGNKPKERCNECDYEANNRHEIDVHSRVHASSSSANASAANVSNTTRVDRASATNADPNNNVAKALVDSLHKCDKCVCYFDDKKRFDEHMKSLHDCHTVCSICDKNLLFKDYDDHVKNSHPDIYKTKKVEGRKERNYVKKFFRGKTGKIVGIYKCTADRCQSELEDETKAKRRAKLHKRLTSRRIDRGAEVNADGVENNLRQEKDIMYTCDSCKISTESYDVVVEHSQRHLIDADPQFATNTCGSCDLKFEPVCYDKHITRHYSEDLNRDSFTHLDYKYQMLLCDGWLKSFNENESVIKRIASKSIYADTRCVKMRVVSVAGTSDSIFNLYQCWKCRHYVDPTSVASHTRNHDTCVNITGEFPCAVCKLSFNAPMALENHVKVHNGNENFRSVVFNTDTDREFNRRLNDIQIGISSLNSAGASTTEVDIVDNILYRCSCLLCFVDKETADDHIKVCPGKDAKKECEKCKNLFNYSQLFLHYVRDHSCNEATSFKIEAVVPDAIYVDGDEPELQTIDLCDDEELEQRETESNTSNTDCVEGMELSDDNEADVQNTNDLQSHGVDNTQAEVLPVIAIKNEQRINSENEDLLYNQDNDDATSEGSNGCVETHDSNSQDTMVNEYIETSDNVTNAGSSVNQSRSGILENGTGLKCVPRDLLINPPIEARSIKQEVGTEMIVIRQQTEDNGVDPIEKTDVKKERPWHVSEPFNYPNITGRPPLRAAATSSIDAPIYDLLTDDEEMTEDANNGTPLNLSSDTPSNNYDHMQNSPDQSGDLAMAAENNTINAIDEDEVTQDYPINEEIDERDWIFYEITDDAVSNSTLTNSALECKENLNALDIFTNNAIINTNKNLEHEELKKIKERHSQQNKHVDLYQNEGSVIKEISVRAIITRADAVNYQNNISIDTNLQITSLRKYNATNFISNRQIQHTYNNRASNIEGTSASSNNTISVRNISKEDKSKKALALVNCDSNTIDTRKAVTQNEQNTENVLHPRELAESYSSHDLSLNLNAVRLSGRAIREEDTSCNIA